MKKLNELYNIDSDVEIKDIKINSKEVEPGDIFVCTMGVKADRHDFIEDAVNHGASALVVSRKGIKASIPVIEVEDTNEELPKLCAKFYDNPEKQLTMIGVTGTDGKTSVATIIQYLLGFDRCGYIGTNGRRCSSFQKDTNNTTPDADKLYGYLREFIDAGCKYTVMESSSEAFFRGRLKGMEYTVSVMTNITKEHLNIHKTFENYIDCKCQLFRQTKKDGFCILNRDDEFFETVKKACNGHVLTYGSSNENDLQIVSYNILPHKTEIKLKYQDKIYEFVSPLLGKFNVYNLCAGLLVGLCLSQTIDEMLPRLQDIKVSGRLELLKTDTPYKVMIDYAHTPNGIKQLLDFVHTLNINRSIVVIGSAGERDYLKRPIMGQTVLDNANYAIFTYEDPRSEDPKDIIDMMISKAKDTHSNYEIVVDRHEAIKRAIDIAQDNDMVLILGKGNETYEKLKDKVIYFNDIEEAYKAVLERKEREQKQLPTS